jgi:hypothetical protein
MPLSPRSIARTVGAVIASLVTWTVVATLLNLALRLAWPEYQAVEKAMAFTLAMLAARLVLGALASLAAGFAAALVSRKAVPWLAGVLLALFIPVHYSLWHRFPVWYHLVFLASLLLLTFAGAMAYRRNG